MTQNNTYGLSRRLLHLYGLICVIATLILICIGGIVTSTGSGLSVPDWPTSYGYNMFLFPFSRWFGDRAIFYEHTHRVVASVVGFLMIGLCVLLWMSHERKQRPWVCWLGTLALFLVVIQGVLGGLRVTEVNNFLGLIHGCVAQIFLALVGAITLFLSKTWFYWEQDIFCSRFSGEIRKNNYISIFSLILTVFVFVQLILGAAMRHQHNGLSVPDFPMAYGRIWPVTEESKILEINQLRHEKNMMPVTAGQIYLHMAHRAMACVILLTSLIFSYRLMFCGSPSFLSRAFAVLLLSTVFFQITLGAWVVLSNKAADIATLHVLCGAFLFLLTSLFTILIFRSSSASNVNALVNSKEVVDFEFKTVGQSI